MRKSIPSTLLNMMPLPIVLVEYKANTLNHPIVFLNNSFSKLIGWTLEDIPDKEHWWQKIYPDEQYQKVVERQWELEVETALSRDDGFVLLKVNLMTKHNGQKRFKVYTELTDMLIQGYYIVALEPSEN